MNFQQSSSCGHRAKRMSFGLLSDVLTGKWSDRDWPSYTSLPAIPTALWGMRKFAEAKAASANAAQTRELAQNAVRRVPVKVSCMAWFRTVQYFWRIFCASVQSRVKLAEPTDYEALVAKNKSQIQSDPYRDLLRFPDDDISVSVRPQSKFFSCPKAVQLDRMEPRKEVPSRFCKFLMVVNVESHVMMVKKVFIGRKVFLEASF